MNNVRLPSGHIPRFANVMSPLSHFLIIPAIIVPIVIFLRPTVFEMLGIFAADFVVSILVFLPLQEKILFKTFPGAKVFYFGFDPHSVSSMAESTQKTLFYDLVQFPAAVAKTNFLLSMLKAVCHGFLIITFWKLHEPSLSVFYKFMLIELLAFAYLSSVIFMEGHQLSSKIIGEIHNLHNWDQVFDGVRLPYTKRDFDFQQHVGMFVIWIAVLCISWTLIVPDRDVSRAIVAYEIFTVVSVASLLISRIIYLNNEYFQKGLENIFSRFEHFNASREHFKLALHTSPVLAKFEQTFNSLMDRLSTSEIELSNLVLTEAEKSRFHSLGEVSALIAHDLSGPLHVINYCSTELLRRASHTSESHLQQIEQNSRRALELVHSLKGFLKNPQRNKKITNFIDIHQNVLRILMSEFFSKGFSKIRFDLDPELEGIYLEIAAPELGHVLYNLYKNSLVNLIQNDVLNPKIQVSLQEIREMKVEIKICDNGTGMHQDEFEKMTGYGLYLEPGTKNWSKRYEALGLRLTRRLVEQNLGELRLSPTGNKQGCCFYLKLPLSIRSKKREQMQVTKGVTIERSECPL